MGMTSGLRPEDKSGAGVHKMYSTSLWQLLRRSSANLYCKQQSIKGRTLTVFLHGEFVIDKRIRRRADIPFKDICISDIRAMGMEIERWADVANNRPRGRSDLLRGLERGVKKGMLTAGVKRV